MSKVKRTAAMAIGNKADFNQQQKLCSTKLYDVAHYPRENNPWPQSYKPFGDLCLWEMSMRTKPISVRYLRGTRKFETSPLIAN